MSEAFHFSAWHGWAVAAVILMICEVFTSDFLPATIAIACGVAAVVAHMGHSMTYQLIAFSAALLVVLMVIRPVVRRSLYHNSDPRLLNVAALVGQLGTVVEPIPGAGSAGRVKLGGEVWRAICLSGASIPEGTAVRIDAVDSSTVHVTAV